MMRIIEIVLPMCNLELAQLPINWIRPPLSTTSFRLALDYALIPPSLPLTIRPSGVSNDPDRSRIPAEMPNRGRGFAPCSSLRKFRFSASSPSVTAPRCSSPAMESPRLSARMAAANRTSLTRSTGFSASSPPRASAASRWKTSSSPVRASVNPRAWPRCRSRSLIRKSTTATRSRRAKPRYWAPI